MWGTASEAYYIVSLNGQWDYEGGYGYNNWLDTDYDVDLSGTSQGRAMLEQGKIKNPTSVPVFVDNAWPDAGWAMETDVIPPSDQRDVPHLSSGTEFLMRSSMNRHERGVNMSFADGSGSAVVIDDLKAILDAGTDAQSIAIFYGAGHMADLEERMYDQLGYEETGGFWLPAVTLDLKREGLSERELTLIRRQLGQ